MAAGRIVIPAGCLRIMTNHQIKTMLCSEVFWKICSENFFYNMTMKENDKLNSFLTKAQQSERRKPSSLLLHAGKRSAGQNTFLNVPEMSRNVESSCSLLCLRLSALGVDD